MNIIKEEKRNDYPESVSLEGIEEILDQMKKKVCKIFIENGDIGTGFFGKIPFPDNNNLLSVLITNNHLINEIILEKNINILISINNEKKNREIKLENRIIYTNKEYDITIIEIKKEDNINNYLYLDENINKDKLYLGKSIYILHYPEKKNIYVSYGIIKNLDDKINFYNFNHLCNIEKGSQGSPILNISNNKLIGIHIKENEDSNYNKGLFLKYALNDFIKQKFFNKELLLEFNKRFHLNFKDFKITELDLGDKIIGNEGLKYLCENIKFTNLKKLYLNGNKITDIKSLEKAKFDNLEVLNFGLNNISNINILEKVGFKELKELYLNFNKISDIKILSKLKLQKLEILHLGDNNISNNINILEKVNSKELKELYLNNNDISDIKVLSKVKFEKLELLDLSGNNISNINVFENVNFRELKELNLCDNQISDIKIIVKVKFEKLEKIDLSDNNIDKKKNSPLIKNLNFELYI